MDSIITADEQERRLTSVSGGLKSSSEHHHNNPFDVSLFTDNAKIRRIPLFAYDEDEYGVGNQVKLKNYSDRKSTRLNSSHGYISYAVFCLKKKIVRNFWV